MTPVVICLAPGGASSRLLSAKGEVGRKVPHGLQLPVLKLHSGQEFSVYVVLLGGTLEWLKD